MLNEMKKFDDDESFKHFLRPILLQPMMTSVIIAYNFGIQEESPSEENNGREEADGLFQLAYALKVVSVSSAELFSVGMSRFMIRILRYALDDSNSVCLDAMKRYLYLTNQARFIQHTNRIVSMPAGR